MAWEGEEFKVIFGYIVKYIRGQPALEDPVTAKETPNTVALGLYILDIGDRCHSARP